MNNYQYKQSGTIIGNPYKENLYLKKRLIDLWGKHQRQQERISRLIHPNQSLDSDTKSSGDPDKNLRKDVDVFHAPML